MQNKNILKVFIHNKAYKPYVNYLKTIRKAITKLLGNSQTFSNGKQKVTFGSKHLLDQTEQLWTLCCTVTYTSMFKWLKHTEDCQICKGQCDSTDH